MEVIKEDPDRTMTTPDSQQRPHSFNSITRSLNNMAGSRSIAPEEWESLKVVISDLYLNQKKTLAEVMRLMEDEHEFQARSVMISKIRRAKIVLTCQ